MIYCNTFAKESMRKTIEAHHRPPPPPLHGEDIPAVLCFLFLCSIVAPVNRPSPLGYDISLMLRYLSGVSPQ